MRKDTAFGAKIGGGESGGGGGPIAKERGLGVGIEGEGDGHPGALRPGFGGEFAANTREVDGLAKLIVGPLSAGLVVLGGEGGGEGQSDEGGDAVHGRSS
jgi:hypothetical protein